MSSNFLKTNGGFVIKKPGYAMFYPIKSDGTVDKANGIRTTATINTITITNSKTKTEIPNGNGFYAAGDRVTAISGTVAIEFSTVDPAIWAMCSGSELTETASDKMLKLYEAEKIDETAYTVVLDDTYATDGFVQVLGTDGTAYEKAESTPSTGEYSIATAEGKTTLTFAAADKGKSVVVSMEVTAATVSWSQGQKAMGNHQIVIDTIYQDLKGSTEIPVNFIISQASVSGDMVDALQKDPSATKTLTFTMYEPLAGEDPYTVKLKNV